MGMTMVVVEEDKPRRRTSTTVVVSLEGGPGDDAATTTATSSSTTANTTITTTPCSMNIQLKPVKQQQKHKHKQWSRFTILAALVFLIFVLGLYASQGGWPELRPLISDFLKPPSDESAEGPPLGILLHPEEHQNRDPGIITLHWTITSGIRAPDGVKKRVYLVNGQFPGPAIEARSGDTIIVQVLNALSSSVTPASPGFYPPPPQSSPYFPASSASPPPHFSSPSPHDAASFSLPSAVSEESISIHWHGLHMRSFNAMDGATGFTQCAIPPGKNFTYEFRIGDDEHGTYWWHAHSQVQRGDGLWGGLVVHRPEGRGVSNGKEVNEMTKYGYKKEVLLMVGDWFHRGAEEMLGWYTSVGGFGNEPVPDSLLINGIGAFNCSMAVPARPVECTQVLAEEIPGIIAESLAPTRLRIVNIGSISGITIGISHAKMTPLQVDGGCEIAGSTSDYVGILYPGERVDLLIEWDSQVHETGSKLKIIMDPENFNYPNPSLSPNQTFPILRPPAQLSTETDIPPLSIAASTPTTYPSFPREPTRFDLQSATSSTTQEPIIPPESNQTILIYIKTEKLAIYGNHPKGFINRTSWAPQSPPLLTLPRSAWDTNQLIPYIPLSPTNSTGPFWVDVILNNLDDGAHPFHLHGYSFYIIATYRSAHGWGSWNPYSDAPSNLAAAPTLNIVDPLRKDTVVVPRRGYAVMRFRADNAGLWMLHCHVLVHLGSGMAMGIEVSDGEPGEEVMDEGAGGLCG